MTPGKVYKPFLPLLFPTSPSLHYIHYLPASVYIEQTSVVNIYHIYHFPASVYFKQSPASIHHHWDPESSLSNNYHTFQYSAQILHYNLVPADVEMSSSNAMNTEKTSGEDGPATEVKLTNEDVELWVSRPVICLELNG